MYYSSIITIITKKSTTFLWKSQYYNTPAHTGFESHCPIIRDHTIKQNSCSKFSACIYAAKNSSLYKIYVVDRIVHGKKLTGVS
jgi:hypothetical protein